MSPQLAALLAGLLGLVFGSFANVVIHRVPRGESVVRPASRCPACRAPVAWRDNLPVLGWLLLGGRCRACRAPIGARYPLVELGMGLLWALLTLRLVQAGLGWAVPAYLALAFVCVVLAVIDASTRLLPNRITYPAFPVVLGLLLVASVGLGDLGRLGRGLLAALAVGAFFLALALISPRGMGLGDVKLALLIGAMLGLDVIPALFIGFLSLWPVGLYLIATQGWSARKAKVPLGPSLAFGAIVVLLLSG